MDKVGKPFFLYGAEDKRVNSVFGKAYSDSCLYLKDGRVAQWCCYCGYSTRTWEDLQHCRNANSAKSSPAPSECVVLRTPSRPRM